jgi:hypothetical protein
MERVVLRSLAPILAALAGLMTAGWPAYVHIERVSEERQAARDRATERRVSNEFQIRALEEELGECLDALER